MPRLSISLSIGRTHRNEDEVGAALKQLFADGMVRREDLFVTTKLWNNNYRPERVKPALQASLNRLGLDSVDLYLVHTPFAFKPGDDQDPRDPHGSVVYDDGRESSCWHSLRWDMRWNPDCSTIRSSSTSLRAPERPPHRSFWPGVFSAAPQF
jgi:diketogulonate reductase-like aldo/keto reductase